jgi:3-methylcrotonyl-CoA carboxylase alpha subunit
MSVSNISTITIRLGRISINRVATSIHLRTFSTSSTRYDKVKPATPSEIPKLENTINKVLIANRGEIACRIIRTCQALDIPTVAIYSSADGPHCLHATMADEAYPIGIGPSSTESYLRSHDIIQIAKQTNANAIHPGFGFLSERAAFAQQIHDANLLFIGPPVTAMMDMASKSQAKYKMELASVPTTPGFDPYNNTINNSNEPLDESIMNDVLYERAIHHIGFPVLIKALMGGGGKGMRLVHSASEFKEALTSCQNEALQSFGDSRVLLEKYLINPRHIEIQIIGDQYGNIVHLYERDCSVQRRHQKVLEEAPASDLSDSFRHHIGQLGVRAAAAVNYYNAGTVEFLLDTQQQQQSQQADSEYTNNIYFCEMNTRLQVEHSVTEQITGIDLVEWQLRVAAGEVLPISNQENIPKINGHSIEARIYAETPTKQFLPSPGHVWYHHPPTIPNTGTNPTTGIRVDTGIQSGQNVSVYYDPMIAKLICHGSTRANAISQLRFALQQYHIAGVATNIDFLLHCIDHPTFHNAGMINTGFLEEFGDAIIQDCINEEHNRKVHPYARLAGAMAILLRIEDRITNHQDTHKNNALQSPAPWSSRWGSWRMGGDSARVQRQLFIMPEKSVVVCTSHRDGSYDIHWKNDDASNEEVVSYHVDGSLDVVGNMELILNHTTRIKLKTVTKSDDEIIQLRMWPESGKSHRNDYHWEIDILDPMSRLHAKGINEGSTTTDDGVVMAPMPGTISRINYKVGDSVNLGDVVVVMEAMKMEHPCCSPCDGIVSEIRCEPNIVVPDSAILFVVTPTQQQSK